MSKPCGTPKYRLRRVGGGMGLILRKFQVKCKYFTLVVSSPTPPTPPPSGEGNGVRNIFSRKFPIKFRMSIATIQMHWHTKVDTNKSNAFLVLTWTVVCPTLVSERSLIDQPKVNPKLFHGCMNQKKICSATVGLTRDANGCLTELFAGSFASVLVRSLPSSNFPHQQFQDWITDVIVTPEPVAKLLQDLGPNSRMI